jgi:hypothetical protein
MSFQLEVAERGEGAAARAFLSALHAFRREVTRDWLHGQLQRASAAEVRRRLAEGTQLQRHLRQAWHPVAAVFLAAGRQAGRHGLSSSHHTGLVRKASVEFTFDQLNPYAVQAATDFRQRLITEVDQDTADAIQATITSGLARGLSPLDTARDVKDIVGLTTRQAQAVLNYRQALETAPRQTLSRTLRDRRYDVAVNRAAVSGEPLSEAQLDRMVERYAERMLAYRAQTIARTETLRAANAGVEAAWLQAESEEAWDTDAFELRRFWVTAGDEKVRPDHAEIPNLNPDGVLMDEPFQYPGGRTISRPGDPDSDADMTINCRCTEAAQLVPKR